MGVLTRVANSLASFVSKAAGLSYICYYMRYDANRGILKHVGRCE